MAQLESLKFKKGSCQNFAQWQVKFFCFQSNLNQTWSNCSTHEYCNLVNFGHDWTENKNFLSLCKILSGPLLKLCQLYLSCKIAGAPFFITVSHWPARASYMGALCCVVCGLVVLKAGGCLAAAPVLSRSNQTRARGQRHPHAQRSSRQAVQTYYSTACCCIAGESKSVQALDLIG